jgi:hypothetical protein
MAREKVNLLNADFAPTNIFMVTYDDVYAHYTSYSSAYLASFQVFLITDGSKSFVLFKYTSCLKDLALLSSSGLNYYIGSVAKQVVIASPCASSNVNETGVWAYEAIGDWEVILGEALILLKIYSFKKNTSSYNHNNNHYNDKYGH